MTKKKMDLMTELTLRDGTLCPLPLIQTVMLTFNEHIETKPLVAYELVMIARDPQHKPFFPDMSDISKGLYKNDRMERSIREVIRNMATGDGLEMSYHSPVKPKEKGPN